MVDLTADPDYDPCSTDAVLIIRGFENYKAAEKFVKGFRAILKIRDEVNS